MFRKSAETIVHCPPKAKVSGSNPFGRANVCGRGGQDCWQLAANSPDHRNRNRRAANGDDFAPRHTRRSPLRFRCQVGHGYTAEALAHEQEGSVDEAMRMAVRVIGERAVLMEKLAGDAHQAGRTAAATTFEARATSTEALQRC